MVKCARCQAVIRDPQTLDEQLALEETFRENFPDEWDEHERVRVCGDCYELILVEMEEDRGNL